MLRDTIRTDYITAKKARDIQKGDALNSLVAAIKNVEIDTRKELTDEEVVKVLRSELKKRQESIELYQKGGRQDLVDKESYEVNLIESYLPQQMSRDEILTVVDRVKNSLGAGANFGQVMQSVMKEVAGKADGKLVSDVVKERM